MICSPCRCVNLTVTLTQCPLQIDEQGNKSWESGSDQENIQDQCSKLEELTWMRIYFILTTDRPSRCHHSNNLYLINKCEIADGLTTSFNPMVWFTSFSRWTLSIASLTTGRRYRGPLKITSTYLTSKTPGTSCVIRVHHDVYASHFNLPSHQAILAS